MRRAFPLLLLLIAMPVFAADTVYPSSGMHRCFVDLLRKAAWGLGAPNERAAFVIEHFDGSLTCEEWPSIHTYHAEVFHGEVPEHAIAIVHTHPAQFPMPSEHDEDEATRLNVPIYTITIRGVYKSMPGARRAETITDKQSWIRETPAPSTALNASRATATAPAPETASNK